METKPTTSPEFDRFTALVDQVLSVPNSDLERIKQTPAPKEPTKSANGKR